MPITNLPSMSKTAIWTERWKIRVYRRFPSANHTPSLAVVTLLCQLTNVQQEQQQQQPAGSQQASNKEPDQTSEPFFHFPHHPPATMSASSASSPLLDNANVNGQHTAVDSDHEHSDSGRSGSLLRRSWQAVLSPFSPSALASLPRVRRPARYLRADNIPETETTEEGERPTVRDYHAINTVPPQVRIPKKVPTSVKVEGKVWFANERSE